MVAHRRTPFSVVLAAVAAALCVSTIAGGSPGNAQEAAPAPAAPATTIATIATVEQQLAQLQAQELEAAGRAEQLAATIAEAQARLATAQRGLAATRARLSSAREQAARLAAAAYRKGSLDPSMLPVALALSDDPTATLRGSSYLDAVLAQQDAVLRRVERAGRELRADEGTLAKRADALRAQQDELSAQQETVKQNAAAAATLLGTLQEQERQRLEAARRAEAERASRSTARTASPAASAAPIDTGSCAPSGSRGAEARLTPATLTIMRCGLTTFPQIDYAGGWGTRGNATDHDDGRAVDFMIPDYRSGTGNDLGWAVAEWASNQPGVDYVMFDRRIFGSWAPEDGWTSVGDRGSDTANHRDHVHVSVKG